MNDRSDAAAYGDFNPESDGVMSAPYHIVLYLYLLGRDNAVEHAKQLRRQCDSISQLEHVRVDIRIATAETSPQTGEPILLLQRIVPKNNPGDSSVERIYGLSHAQELQAFLRWASEFDDEKTHSDCKRIFLISGHGSPVHGFGEFVPERSNSVMRHETGQSVRACNNLQRARPLTIRQLSRLLSKADSIKARQQTSHVPFDVVVLHGCTQGLVEVAFELRHATRTVIACPAVLTYRMSIDKWFSVGVRRQKTAAKLARFFLLTEALARAKSCADFAMFAVKTADEGNHKDVANAWDELFCVLREMCSALRCNSTAQSTAARLQQIQKQVSDGIIRRSEVRDLLLLAQQIEKADSDRVNIVHGASIATRMDAVLRRLQIGGCVSLGEAETDAFCGNMAIYFPAERTADTANYRPPTLDDATGFELLDRIGWYSLINSIPESNSTHQLVSENDRGTENTLAVSRNRHVRSGQLQ